MKCLNKFAVLKFKFKTFKQIEMNTGFKVAISLAILTAFFAVAGNAQQTNFFKGWWVFFSWLTFIGFVVGGIMEIWKKR